MAKVVGHVMSEDVRSAVTEAERLPISVQPFGGDCSSGEKHVPPQAELMPAMIEAESDRSEAGSGGVPPGRMRSRKWTIYL